jgi:hypothetical protein
LLLWTSTAFKNLLVTFFSAEQESLNAPKCAFSGIR